MNSESILNRPINIIDGYIYTLPKNPPPKEYPIDASSSSAATNSIALDTLVKKTLVEINNSAEDHIPQSKASLFTRWLPDFSTQTTLKKEEPIINPSLNNSGWFSNIWNTQSVVKKREEPPFDEGKHTWEEETLRGFSNQFRMEDRNTITRIGNYTHQHSLEINGARVLWSDIFKADVHRMVPNKQITLNHELLSFDGFLKMDETQEAEEVVKRIYELTGHDKEITLMVTGMMCQNATNFLFHSAARQLGKKFNLTPIFNSEESKGTFHLYTSKAKKGDKPEVLLDVKLEGKYPLGVFESQDQVEFMENPGELDSRLRINFSKWIALINYEVKLTEEAIAKYDTLLKAEE